jgi:hypothetical protein
MTADSPAPADAQQVIRPRLVFEPWPDGLSLALAKRAEKLVNQEWDSLTEAVLHAHLLIEQALTERLRRKFAHPEVLDNGHLARLGFAQMLTVYAGLYDPKPEDLQRLRAFNRLRNRVAHALIDADELITENLRSLTPEPARSSADLLALHFFFLFFGELVGIKGAHRHDPDGVSGQPTSRNNEGQPVCHVCGTR